MYTAIASLVIFFVCIVLFIWDILPMATSAILGCVAMVVFQCCDFATAFGQFASTTVVILVAIQVVGAAMAETGFANAIGKILLKFSKGRERWIMLIAYVLACFLSSFLTNVTVLAVFMPIIIGIGKTNKKINHMNLILPVLVATSMGGISTLVGSSQQLTAVGLIEEVGYSVKVFDLTPVGLILAFAGLVFCLFIGYPLGKKIWGNRDVSEVTVDVSEKEINKVKVIIMSVIFVLMIVGYVTTVIPVAVTAVAAALLCIITGCVKQKDAVTKINWDVVGRLGACLGIAKALTKAGGIKLLSSWIMNVFGGNMTPFGLFIVAVLLTQVLSLVISNSTAILLVLPVIISLAPEMNLNLLPYCLGIAYASSCGLCCPLSGSTVTMSMAAGYKFRDYFKYGVIFDLICFVLIVLFTPLIFPLTL